MTVLWLRQDLNGSILDVGGGGEGVIGRLVWPVGHSHRQLPGGTGRSTVRLPEAGHGRIRPFLCGCVF